MSRGRRSEEAFGFIGLTIWTTEDEETLWNMWSDS